MKRKGIIRLAVLLASLSVMIFSCDRNSFPGSETGPEDGSEQSPDNPDDPGEDSSPQIITVSEFLAKDVDTTWYWLEATIITIENTEYGNFWVKDSTGILYVYGMTGARVEQNDKSFASLDLEIGDELTFVTRRTEHNGQPQAGGSTWPAYYVSHVDKENVVVDEVLVSEQPRKWMELPSFSPADDQAYVAYYAANASGSPVRNYSMLYDASERVALWVAYPLCEDYIGESGRSEAWNFDPWIPDIYEPVIPRSWGPEEYNRGHQIPSADRTATDAMNAQTFYFSNMTVQNAELNQGVWGELENQAREWAAECDTLYVVTGPVLDADGDGNLEYMDDNAGNKVAIPDAYFKAFLKWNADGDCHAIAFYFENREYSYIRPWYDDMLTVAELERTVGITFFAGLSDDLQSEVKNRIDYEVWGYPSPTQE